MNTSSISKFLRSLGPGLIFASTAIGVSHLVQSTRAGADYGFGLLWAILLANILKYPFFEFGSRYAAGQGESLIDGYARIGKWALGIYTFITLGTMFFVSAAVGAVTAGFLYQLFDLSGYLSLFQVNAILFAICIGILFWGHYKGLSQLIKVVGSVLVLSTLAAFIATLVRGPSSAEFNWFDSSSLEFGSPSFAFLIALMGWMPTAVDLSAWNSLWTIAQAKEQKLSFKEIIREFRFGYWLSALLAPCFMILGAYLIYGTEKELGGSAAAFAGGIINLYTESMGAWSKPIISASAFSIMFGTCIAVFDGYARVGEKLWSLYTQQSFEASKSSNRYRITLLFLGIGGLGLIGIFSGQLKGLVDLATAISFLIAPLIAGANYYLVLQIPEAYRPKGFLRILSVLGIIFLSGFSLIYVLSLFVS